MFRRITPTSTATAAATAAASASVTGTSLATTAASSTTASTVQSPLRTPTRGTYSIWHATVNEPEVTKNVPLHIRMSNQSAYRGFYFNHVAMIEPSDPENGGDFVSKMTPCELYLYSAVVDDTKRLLGVDWAIDFDSFWIDRVASHKKTYDVLYGNKSGILKFILGKGCGDIKAKEALERELHRLDSVLKWAVEAERVSSVICNARYHFQREVYDALEREKYLGGCVEVFEEYCSKVPSEFKRKAEQDIGLQLSSIRHFIWDMPNIKRSFPRILV